MQIRSYGTLVTIADVGSFAEAAKRLNMTLSAVSMQIKVLEQELDAILFDRSQRPPRLTVKGREIVKHARAIVDAERTLLKACRPQGQLRGVFHVGFVLSASVRLLPGFLTEAGIRMPDVRFEVETGLSEHLERKIVDGQLDLAVLTMGDRNSTVLDVAVLQTEPLVYALPRSAARRKTPWLMQNLPFLHFAPTSGIGRLITTHITGLDTPPQRTIVLDGMESIVECVKQGIGFTILPEPDIARYADDGLVTRVVSRNALSRDIVLVARRANFTEHQFAELRHLFGAR